VLRRRCTRGRHRCRSAYPRHNPSTPSSLAEDPFLGGHRRARGVQLDQEGSGPRWWMARGPARHWSPLGRTGRPVASRCRCRQPPCERAPSRRPGSTGLTPTTRSWRRHHRLDRELRCTAFDWRFTLVVQVVLGVNGHAAEDVIADNTEPPGRRPCWPPYLSWTTAGCRRTDVRRVAARRDGDGLRRSGDRSCAK
jgi:hypothetical protein